MKNILLIMCMGLLPFSLKADTVKNNPAAAKRIKLTATLTVQNRGNQVLSPYNISLTYPAVNMPQQKLVGIEYRYREKYSARTHVNNVDSYLVLPLTIPPRSTVTREITFTIVLTRYDYREDKPVSDSGENISLFLKPSLIIESDAPEVRAIARDIMSKHDTIEDRLFAAYRYPQEHLRYTKTGSAKGALQAIASGTGDCTEYAALFVALARAMDVPARMTAEFNFKKTNTFSQPNHNAAEIYFNGRWIPIDPNLGLVPSLGYGFGTCAQNKVVLKRNDSWVWSKPGSVKGITKDYLRENAEVRLGWKITADR